MSSQYCNLKWLLIKAYNSAHPLIWLGFQDLISSFGRVAATVANYSLLPKLVHEVDTTKYGERMYGKRCIVTYKFG